MPLIFSPLDEDVLSASPKALFPKSAFIMRQLGKPSELDLAIYQEVSDILKMRGIDAMDASSSTGAKDYLERIVGLIRSTGFTVAIFSHETRSTAMSNICLELGFAAMCGKPIMIVKSSAAEAPSDIKRTDWISYDQADIVRFRDEVGRALDGLDELAAYYRDTLLPVVLDARSPDCAIALERINKAFLLSAEEQFIEAAASILQRLEDIDEGHDIADIERLRQEARVFIAQARSALRR